MIAALFTILGLLLALELLNLGRGRAHDRHLRRLVKALRNREEMLMADIDDLEGAEGDLEAAVTAAAANMDEIHTELLAALEANNPERIRSATARIKAQAQALRDATQRDAPPTTPS